MSSAFHALSYYEQACDFLGTMTVLRCETCCKEGGGFSDCAIRNCCLEKEIDGCWMCEEFSKCKKLAWLGQVYGNGHLRNQAKIKEQGMDVFLEDEKHW